MALFTHDDAIILGMLFAKYFSCLLYRNDSGGAHSYVPKPRGSSYVIYGDGRGGNIDSGWLGRAGKPGFADSLLGATNASKPGGAGTMTAPGRGGKEGGFKIGGSAPDFAPQGGGGAGLFGGGSGYFQGGGGGGSSLCLGGAFFNICQSSDYLASIFLTESKEQFILPAGIQQMAWVDADLNLYGANELMRYLSCKFSQYYANIIPDRLFVNPISFIQDPEAELLRANALAVKVRNTYTYGEGNGAVYITFGPNGHQLFEYDYNLIAEGFDFDTPGHLDYRYKIQILQDELGNDYTATTYDIEVPVLTASNELVDVDIWCLGAQGGNYLSDSYFNDSANSYYMYGGFGGNIQGRFKMLPGTRIRVKLGERGYKRKGYRALNGGGAGDGGCTGGGGVTYVCTINEDETDGNMIIAAGGGGGCFGFADLRVPDPFYVMIPGGDATQNPGTDGEAVTYDVNATEKFMVNDRSIVYVEFMYYTPTDLTEDGKAKCIISIQNGLDGTLVDLIDLNPEMGSARFIYELDQIYATGTASHEVTIDCVISSKEAMTIGGKVTIRVETKVTTADEKDLETNYNFNKNNELISLNDDIRLSFRNNFLPSTNDFLIITDVIRLWYESTPQPIYISNTEELSVLDVIRNIINNVMVEVYRIGEQITIDEVVRKLLEYHLGSEIHLSNIDTATIESVVRDILKNASTNKQPIIDSNEAEEEVRIWFE